eukprot:scaffold8030_cov417-Prasinococcus_capsulatus_cf.AAC.6
MIGVRCPWGCPTPRINLSSGLWRPHVCGPYAPIGRRGRHEGITVVQGPCGRNLGLLKLCHEVIEQLVAGAYVLQHILLRHSAGGRLVRAAHCPRLQDGAGAATSPAEQRHLHGR